MLVFDVCSARRKAVVRGHTTPDQVGGKFYEEHGRRSA